MKHLLIAFLFTICWNLFPQENLALALETKRDSILASVNGDPITLLDIILESNADEARLAAMYTGTELIRKIEEVRSALLESLIQRKLIYASYKGNPFEIPKQHIEDAIDSLAILMGDGTRESLERRVKSYGSSMEVLREKAREKIATEVLIYRNCIVHVQITPKEVYETYEANPEKWSKPERLKIQLLQILKKKTEGSAAPEEIVKNLQVMLKDADEDIFGEIVKKNSSGPNAAQGGKMGWIDRDKLRPEFEAALKNTQKGEIAGPVETPEAFYFIRLSDLAAAEKVPFEKAYPEIEKELRNAAILKRKEKYITELKEQAVIEVLILIPPGTAAKTN